MKSRSTRHRTALSHVLHASDIFRRFSPEVAQSVRRPDITNQSYLEQAKKARQMLREMKPGQVLQMIEVHKDLEFVDALELAKRENKIIIPNYAAAKILEILRYQENDPRPSFMLWSGTLIIYEKPDEPFEDKIVFTWQHASIYYTIVFDIPEQFRGKRNCALVVEHPDFVLTKIDDNHFLSLSIASLVISSKSCFNISYAFIKAAGSTLTAGILLTALTILSCLSPVTIKALFLLLTFCSILTISFVLPEALSKPDNPNTPLSISFADKAEISAAFFILWGRLSLTFLVFGPNTIPPPTNIGALIEPCLALPVPFCL